MPTTAARAAFIPLAIRWFLAQTYEQRELVVVADGWHGASEIDELVPRHPRIRYVHFGMDLTLGAKLNAAVDECRGEYIAVWEDDDWHGPTRLACQMAALTSTGAAKCGASRMLFWDLQDQRMRRLTMPRYVAHGSVVAHRSVFERQPYPDRNDGDFEWQARSEVAAVEVDADGWYVGMRHGGNTWRTAYSPPVWADVELTLAAVAGAEVAAAYARLS